MQAVRAQLPTNETNDKRLHCMASAKIARQCSISEAYLAGVGKELRDLVTGGDAEWADWQADRVGVQCSRRANDAAAIQACCAAHGD